MAASTYKVFLSHSSKDKEFVRELYRRLTRDGVSCFLDEKSIGWGDNWVRALERAVDECESIVFVLSPDFCDSKWVEVERTSSMADDPAALKRKVLPLKLIACSHLPTFPRFLRQAQTIDVTTPANFETNYEQICRGLGGVPQTHLDQPDRTTLPPVLPLPARHRMPYRSLGDKFIGRVEPLWQIRDAFQSNKTALIQGTGVLVGTGGLGKTQLAIEYVHRFGAGYPGGVYWVDADQGLTTLITQISTAAKIDIDTRAPEPHQLADVWQQLNAQAQACLIVLDNFPETGPLQPYLPVVSRAHTLITTRRTDLQHPSIPLLKFTPAESLALLNAGQRQFGTEAQPLLERLGGLPLAIELAKGFLNYRPDLTIDQVLTELNQTGEIELLKRFAADYRDQLPSGHELDVAKTFELSWNIALPQDKAIVRVIGELAPVAVPRSLLREILNLPNPKGLDDPLAISLAELQRLSLVELDDAQNPLAHRLIQAFARHRNSIDNTSPLESCATTLRDQFLQHFKSPDAPTMHALEALLPHAEHLFTTASLAPDLAISLASGIAAHHQAFGRYQASKLFSHAALNLAQQSYAPGHPTIAIRQSNLALVLQELGELGEARDLLRSALASDEHSYAAGHPSIARSQSNLATVLQDLGELGEARDLLRSALASAEQSYAPGHPSIAIGQSNLATVLQELGELGEARDLLRSALASNEKSYAPGHPSIAIGKSNLAMVLKDLGELGEARDLLRSALASNEQSYAPGHPSIATCQSNLAMVLKDLGEMGEARDLLRSALASNEKSYAPGHPLIAISHSNLATVLQDLGELGEARDLLRSALASDEQSYAPGHPTIATRQSNLALVLLDLGELGEARDLLNRAYQSLLHLFGEDHPNTKSVKRNLDSLRG